MKYLTFLRPGRLPSDASEAQVLEYCNRTNGSWINWRGVRYLRHWKHLLFPPWWAQGRRYFSTHWWKPDAQ